MARSRLCSWWALTSCEGGRFPVNLPPSRHQTLLAAIVLSLVLLVASAQTSVAAGPSAPVPNTGCTTTVTTGTGGAPWVPLVQQALAWLCPHFGPLNAPVQVSVGTGTQGGAWPYAEAQPVGTAAGSLSSCPITMETLMGVSDSNARIATVTHELWHCYEAQIMGPGPYSNAVSAHPLNVNGASWLIEGSAEWVGECSVGDCSTQGSFISGQWWDQYLSNPQTPLFQRGYDAVGFYAHMQESGISPFDRLPAMLTAGSDTGAFAAAQINDAFLETWAGGYARQPSWGPVVWDTTGPGITTTAPAVPSTDMSNGGSATDDVKAYSNDIEDYSLTADVVTISVGFDGHGEMHTADGSTLDGPALNDNFCTLVSGCSLPSASCPPTSPLAAGDAMVAVNGGTSGSHVTIVGQSLADFCQSQPTVDANSTFDVNCSVQLAGTAHEIVNGVTRVTEPAQCAGSVQGNVAIEVFTHPGQAGALLNVATQNVGAPAMTCNDLLAGDPRPFITAPAPEEADLATTGAAAYLGCFYSDMLGVPDHLFTTGVQVFWFDSATQAQQLNEQFEQHPDRTPPGFP